MSQRKMKLKTVSKNWDEPSFQEKLMPVIDGASAVERNVDRLIRGFHLLDIPSLVTVQYVKGLGDTLPNIRRAFDESGGYQPIEKRTSVGV